MFSPRILFAFLIVPLAKQFAVGLVNYSVCKEKIQGLQLTCHDPQLVCPNGKYPPGFSADRPPLSVTACYNQCGRGFELLPGQDSVGMVSLWLVPIVVLIGHFHFPALGKRNTLALVVSLVSNPIGCMWSMLTRQEAFRRLYRKACTMVDRDIPIAKAIATVAAACDEIAWQNPLEDIEKFLRSQIESSRENNSSQEESSDGNGKSSGEKVSEQGSNDGSKSSKSSHSTSEEKQPMNAIDSSRSLNVALRSDVTLPFVRARIDLITNRDGSQLTTWLAIVGLIGSLVSAFVKNVTAEQRQYLPRTIAMVNLGVHFITLVQISGNIGRSRSIYGPLHIIRRLQSELRAQLGATFDIDYDFDDSSTLVERQIIPNYESWMEKAPYLGANPTWRPNKSLALHGAGDRHPYWLLFCSFVVVSISFASALFVSLKAARRPGYGCQCLTWTVIYCVWLLNAGIDYLVHRITEDKKKGLSRNKIRRFRCLWKYYFFKDLVVTIGILAAVLVYVIGLSSTCTCSAGSIVGSQSHNYVNLWSATDRQWSQDWIQGGGASTVSLALNCLFVLILTWDQDSKPIMPVLPFDRTRTLFSPNRKEIQELQLDLLEATHKVNFIGR